MQADGEGNKPMVHGGKRGGRGELIRHPEGLWVLGESLHLIQGIKADETSS